MDQSPSPPSMAQPSPLASSKRYRPSPAKTFQCRGYGECRMVFSRSEHLARHVRKHTGERPFTCHCAKQFSRLDNLRQHAQTVHADKQDDNERMMRELTSLHATMSAANKLAGPRPGRKANGGNSATTPLILIKQEDVAHQRPDTSTGYEGGEAMYPDSFRDSFREPSQSFLGPPSTGAAPAVHSQSFLGYSGSQLQVPDPSDRPQSRSRPATSSALANPLHPRSLPPLSAVVSASLPSPPSGPHPAPSQLHQLHHQQPLLPFPSHHRRSSTHRPGTAPASASLFARASFSDRSRLGSSSGRPDLSLLHSGFGGRPFGFHLHQHLGDSPDPSTSPGNDSSPFYFNPPPPNPRKRPFGGPDGPSEDPSQLRDRPTSSAGPFSELNYEYGSESRPQSRRLTVMELCNDDDSDPRPPSQRAFLLPNHDPSRPTTSSGLVTSTSTLRLFDRATSPSSTQPSALLPRTSYAATGTNGDGTPGGRGSAQGGRAGSGEHATSCSRIPSGSSASAFSATTPSPSTPTPAVLSPSNSPNAAPGSGQHYPKQYSPSLSTASNESCSPRSDSSSPGGSPFPPYAHPSKRVYAGRQISSANAHTSAGISAQSRHLHRHQQRDAQVRASVSPHAASFGMRV